MVLGAYVYGTLLLDGLIRGSIEVGRERPTAQNTVFGWILSGPIPTYSVSDVQSHHVHILHTNVEFDLRKFWEMDDVYEETPLSESELECEQHFSQTHQRDETGRYC